jgi:hypothetical protein
VVKVVEEVEASSEATGWKNLMCGEEKASIIYDWKKTKI